MISFFVPGIPAPRKRRKAKGYIDKATNNPKARTYSDKSNKEQAWDSALLFECRRHRPDTPFDGPLFIGVTFWMPRPQDHYRKNGQLKPNAPEWCDKKPDRDNLDKPVLDALEKAGVISNDARACDGPPRKKYADPNPQGVFVEIKKL